MLVNFNTVVGSFILEALVLWFQQLGKNDVEIVEGVGFGDTILTSGLLQVKDKMPVKIKK